MALPRDYYLDKRPFVSGKSNRFLNLASSYHLNDLISQIVLNTAPGNNQLPLLFNNAITPNYVQGQGTYVQWGGPLVQNTEVEGGNAYSVSMLKLTDFIVTATTSIDLTSSLLLTLTGTTGLEVQTPLYASRPDGAILRKDNASGAVEYTPYALPASDGTANYILQTDGAGSVTWVAPNTIGSLDNIYNTDGTLTGPRVVSGGGTEQLRFSGMTDFTVSSITNQIEFSTAGSLLLSPGNLEITGLTNTGTVGRVLQYVNNSTDEAYWTPYDIPTTTPNTGDILVATDGDSLGFQAQYQSVSYHVADSNIDLSTISGTAAIERFMSIPAYMNGWKLHSITLLNDGTGGAVTALDYSVTQNGGTTLTSDSWSGSHSEDDTMIVHTVSTGDIIKFDSTSGGNNILGLSITFTFKSN